MNKSVRNALINLSISLLSMVLCLGFAEFLFRRALFSKNPAFEQWRDPALYTNADNEEDFWKLKTLWSQNQHVSGNNVDFVGWSLRFNPNTFMHYEADQCGTRKPVLLFGDSFAQCVDSTECFHEILNKDRAFNKDYYMLNYGCGGYGVDQIYTLMRLAEPKYKKPFVIFSMLTFDLDRSILSFRDRHKPYYTIEHDSLVFHNNNMQQDAAKYVEEHPVELRSFLWRKLLHSAFAEEHFPAFSKRMLNEDGYTERKKQLNAKILEAAVNKLRSDSIDFTFAVFCGWEDCTMPEEQNWREHFLRDFVNKHQVPCIWTRDIYKKHTLGDDSKFFITGNGHPTSYFNQLISDEFKSYITSYYANKQPAKP